MARANVTVALSGDGGDELFGGYNNYRADAIAGYYRTLPGWVRALVRGAASPLQLESRDGMSAAAKIGRLIRLGDMAPPDGHAWWLAVFSDEMKRSLYADAASCDTAARAATRYRDRFPSGSRRDFLNDCMAVDLSTVLPFDYLRKADRMSMANSLELRVPLLDRQLVEFLFSLPSRTKVSATGTKLLLRRAVRGLLPDDTIAGRKRGFSIPLSRWLRTEWRTLVGDVLSPAAARRHGLLSPAIVQRYVDEHLAGVRDHGKVVWVLMCLQLWLERGITPAAVPAPVGAAVSVKS
jgi:asparagine synthase (glutamine-hydrolysing)